MPVPKIVIHTSVTVAGLRSRNGSAFRLLELVGGERFGIHLSVPLVLEYEEVLLRELPNLAIGAPDIRDFAEKISALTPEGYRQERASRGKRAKSGAVLAKVADVEPEPHDRLPPA